MVVTKKRSFCLIVKQTKKKLFAITIYNEKEK